MGYFSNNTEGDLYEEEYCRNCVHDKNHSCPIMLAHGVYNYDQMNKGYEDLRKVLTMLIPRSKSGVNQECAMFVNKAGDTSLDAEIEFHKLQHWNAGTPIRG